MTGELDEIIARKAKRRHVVIRNTLVTTAIVVIVALSVFSGFTYRQMRDYHDAKYRSQSEIVSYMEGYAESASNNVQYAVNTSLSLEFRGQAGSAAVEQLGFLEVLDRALWEMYLNDHEKCETFSLLYHSLGSFNMWLSEYQLGIVNSQDLRMRLASSAIALGGLVPILNAGFRSDVDFEKHPYSIVDGMDLASIRNIATSITEQFQGAIQSSP